MVFSVYLICGRPAGPCGRSLARRRWPRCRQALDRRGCGRARPPCPRARGARSALPGCRDRDQDAQRAWNVEGGGCTTRPQQPVEVHPRVQGKWQIGAGRQAQRVPRQAGELAVRDVEPELKRHVQPRRLGDGHVEPARHQLCQEAPAEVQAKLSAITASTGWPPSPRSKTPSRATRVRRCCHSRPSSRVSGPCARPLTRSSPTASSAVSVLDRQDRRKSTLGAKAGARRRLQRTATARWRSLALALERPHQLGDLRLVGRPVHGAEIDPDPGWPASAASSASWSSTGMSRCCPRPRRGSTSRHIPRRRWDGSSRSARRPGHRCGWRKMP